jgi:AraC family transcriptional regulator, regulatory protein of adaptative response / methylated-DNA-[protein]-cysteine methyltransferase
LRAGKLSIAFGAALSYPYAMTAANTQFTLALGNPSSLGPLGWAWIDTTYGPALAMASAQGLCGLGLAGGYGQEWAMADLQARWPAAQFAPDTNAAALAQRALSGHSCTLHLIGSAFDLRVWQALLHIPIGQTTSYGQLAATIGAHRAHRAVASAVGRNPLGLIVPCHRVLRSTGALGGYHWGLALKQDILANERAAIFRPPAQEIAIETAPAIP